MSNMNKQELYNLIYNLTFKTEKYAVGFHLCGNLDVNGGRFWWQKNYDYGITGEYVAELFRYVHMEFKKF